MSYELARRLIGVRHPLPAYLDVPATRLASKRQAYALAFALMAKADETYPEETS